MSDAKLTWFGKFISLLLIAGFIGAGYWMIQKKQTQNQKPNNSNVQQNSQEPTAKNKDASQTEPIINDSAQKAAEAPDLTNITTVKEYKYVPSEKLPSVKGISAYLWDEKEKILKFSYNVWIGWLPVIAANHGTKPNTESVFFKKYGFKVEMVLMDDPIAARDAYAAGKIQTLWGTVDMMTLFAPELMKDSRTAPRIFQAIDWSNGGDGIVTRTKIKSVRDLKGATIVCAQNSPSEYFIASLLITAGLRMSDVNMKYTNTAFEAAAAFVADKNIDACVSWAPDIYNISERVAGTKILTTTAEANKLISDVYAIRADFCRDHMDIVKGLVSGIFEGMDIVKKSPDEAIQAMAEAFGMTPEDVRKMTNDAHSTNFAENAQFFLNENNPTNFERTWKNSTLVYRELGRIDAPVEFDRVSDFSVIKELSDSKAFPNQKDESVTNFVVQNYKKTNAENPIITQTIRINFFPNSANPFEVARDEYGMVKQGTLYDPNVNSTLERVARLAGQFERCVILVEGHTDSSMKGLVPFNEVKQLSKDRAESIKQSLVQKWKFDPNKFIVEGKGWNEPANLNSPNNQALNRRVEISVLPPENN